MTKKDFLINYYKLSHFPESEKKIKKIGKQILKITDPKDFDLKKMKKVKILKDEEDEEDFDLKNVKVNNGDSEDGNDNVEILKKVPEHPHETQSALDIIYDRARKKLSLAEFYVKHHESLKRSH